MEHGQKISWMKEWAHNNKLRLELQGECGFGRECVGVIGSDCYPEYHWYSEEDYDREDENGEVWRPEDAYHKHECVAVLGRGENAEAQLYDWLKWFEENGFVAEEGFVKRDKPMSQVEILLGMHKYCRMVRTKK